MGGNSTYKKLRKQIYGDFAIRDTKYRIFPDGSIFSVGRRRAYQAAKKMLKQGSESIGRLKTGKLRVPKWLSKTRKIVSKRGKQG